MEYYWFFVYNKCPLESFYFYVFLGQESQASICKLMAFRAKQVFKIRFSGKGI